MAVRAHVVEAAHLIEEKEQGQDTPSKTAFPHYPPVIYFLLIVHLATESSTD
jgi:hypothetical protein